MRHMRNMFARFIWPVMILGYCVLAPNVQAACDAQQTQNYRTLDGYCNNLAQPDWGAKGTLMVRILPALLDTAGPNEREISNKAIATRPEPASCNLTFQERRSGLTPDPRGLNHLAVIFGQFLSHDTDFIPTPFNPRGSLAQNFNVTIPGCNASTIGVVDELCTTFSRGPVSGVADRIFTRPSQGMTMPDGTFLPFNNVSSYIDLNTIYGTDNNTLSQLRTYQGGRMLVDADNSVPLINATGPITDNECGLGTVAVNSHAAGDFRVDQNFVITLLTALFLRHHNYLAADLAVAHPEWDDEALFQNARALNIAMLQHLLYDEWAPAMFGERAVKKLLGEYEGYDPSVNGATPVEFATAAFRMHTMLNLPLLTFDDNCTVLLGNIQHFNDEVPKVQERQSCEALVFKRYPLIAHLRGALLQSAQKFDNKVTDGLRNLRIGAPGNVDVEAANLFRGRLHNLPKYDAFRVGYGLDSVYTKEGCKPGYHADGGDSLACFKYISGNNDTLAKVLRQLYNGNASRVDTFMGLISDAPYPGGSVGKMATVAILHHLHNSRAADRFWYEGALPRWQVKEIKATTMAQLLRLHFPEIGDMLGDNAFFVNTKDVCRNAKTTAVCF